MDGKRLEDSYLNKDLDEIISRSPGWVIQRGISIMGFFFVLVVLSGSLINSPEINVYPCRLLAEYLPVQFSLKSFATLKKLHVYHGKLVHKGDVLFQWEDSSGQRFTVLSPITGVVQFASYPIEEIKKPEKRMLLYVQPIDSLFAAFYVDQETTRLLKRGQNAQIAIDGYPETIYGNLSGKVRIWDTVASGAKYFVKVYLVNSLTTDKNKVIPFNSEMHGTISIAVKKRRIISRITDNVMKWY